MTDTTTRTIDDAVAYPYASDVIYKIEDISVEVYYAGMQCTKKGSRKNFPKKTMWHIFYEPGEKIVTKYFVAVKPLSEAKIKAIMQEKIIPKPYDKEFIENGPIYSKKLYTYTADVNSHAVTLINERFNSIKQKEQTLAERV